MYLLSLHTMCTVMGGDGAVGDGRDLTGMLTTFQKGKKWVTVDNIVGIAWSKLNVMDPVETLRS